MAWEIETVFDLDDATLFDEMVAIDLGQFMWDSVEVGGLGYDQWQDNLNSYTVPVDAESLEDVQFDSSVDPMPDWGSMKLRFFDYARGVHQAEFDQVDLYSTLESMLPDQLTGMFKRSDWLTSDVEPSNLKPLWKDVYAAWLALEDLRTRKEIVYAAYKTMNDNIDAEMYNVFNTNNQLSALAFSQSWQMKADRPSEYSGLGITADEALAGFSVGDPLDTDQKIMDYFNAKVDKLIAFDKFRDVEIVTYLTVKAAQGL